MPKSSILILTVCCAASLNAGTVDIPIDANSQLEEASPNTTWVDYSTLILANWMPGQEIAAIFKFSLASVPVGATVTGASLRLYDDGFDDSHAYTLFWHADSSWSPTTVTWNNFSTTSDPMVSYRGGSAGWQYNSWDIDVSTWNWAADLAQGAVTFELREGYGDYYANQNNYNSMAASGGHPYLQLTYEGGTAGTQTPEPGSLFQMASGLIGGPLLLHLARRRRNRGQ